MNRRDALSTVTLLLGGTIVGADVFLSGCSSSTETLASGKILSGEQIAFLDEVGEIIIPTTPDSPGAKAAKIGEFMDLIVKDCYTAEEQRIFIEGISKLDESSKSKLGKGYMDANADDKKLLLLDIEKEVNEYKKTKQETDPVHYYDMMKQLTVWGYFSSEVGATQALAHVAVPGRYEACVPLKEGQKAWG